MTAVSALLAGSRLLAAELQGVAPAPAFKGANQSVTNSTTLVNDSALFLPLTANGTWIFIGYLSALSTVAMGSGDLKIDFTWPSGASGSWTSGGFAASAGGSANWNAVRTASGGTADGIGVGTTPVPAIILGSIIMGSTAGNLQLEFAQNSASSGNSITVQSGSWLAAWQIA